MALLGSYGVPVNTTRQTFSTFPNWPYLVQFPCKSHSALILTLILNPLSVPTSLNRPNRSQHPQRRANGEDHANCRRHVTRSSPSLAVGTAMQPVPAAVPTTYTHHLYPPPCPPLFRFLPALVPTAVLQCLACATAAFLPMPLISMPMPLQRFGVTT